MNYGHIKNGKLIRATFPIKHNGIDYFTKNPEELLSLGEKEIVNTDKPDLGKGKYIASWKETDTQIVREWIIKPYSEEELRQKYEHLVLKYIREKYSLNEELKISREYLAYGEPFRTSFEEYNSYVESCKTRAYGEIYGNSSVE